MQKGIFNDIQTNAHLSFSDCLDLSKKSILLNVETMAYQWLQVADQLRKDADADLEELEKTWQNLISTCNVISKEELHSHFLNKRQQSFPNLYSYGQYATCRGEKKTVRFEFDKLSNLKCLYASFHWNPYFTISRVKVEVLVEEPSLVLQFHDFLGDEVIEFVERETSDKLRRSVEENMETGNSYVNHQSSMVTWIDDEKYEILRKLRRRIEMLTAINKRRTSNSGMKVVLYGALGGFYDFHHDAVFFGRLSNNL